MVLFASGQVEVWFVSFAFLPFFFFSRGKPLLDHETHLVSPRVVQTVRRRLSESEFGARPNCDGKCDDRRVAQGLAICFQRAEMLLCRNVSYPRRGSVFL